MARKRVWWNLTKDPTPQQIAEACGVFQRQWSIAERNHRLGKYGDEEWSPPQYLVHHTELGKWATGRGRKTLIWRCVDGR